MNGTGQAGASILARPQLSAEALKEFEQIFQSWHSENLEVLLGGGFGDVAELAQKSLAWARSVDFCELRIRRGRR